MRCDRVTKNIEITKDPAAIKALSFGNAINVTLGVPITRTSVDHGVALDIAGSGKADPSSLKEAIKAAKKII